MATYQPRKLIWRCPVCFSRENDVSLFESAPEQFYCPKCSFTGDLDNVKEMYTDLRKKYRWIQKRVTLAELRTL